jgi:hypothetical protein
MEAALRGQGVAEVPCGSCSACCTASQFVHIGPDEEEALAAIPAELLFPAPLSPPGHVLLGYDERGHCPMLRDGRCSIYDRRPRACRTYDCRVFAAADVGLDGDGEIAGRARGWRFSFSADEDAVRERAVRAAAVYLRDRPELVAGDGAVLDATRHAVASVAAHSAFVRRTREGALVLARPDPEDVRRLLQLASDASRGSGRA